MLQAIAVVCALLFGATTSGDVKRTISSVVPVNGSYAWDEWWAYEGASGPFYWGISGPWKTCSLGKKQSPIDINPKLLLYDPNLKHFHLDKHRVDGMLHNTGRDVSFRIDEKYKLLLKNGPLSYDYAVSNVTFHWGSKDGQGSEHTINGEYFSAEIQIMAYNHRLFDTVKAAQQAANGIAMIAVLVKIGDSNNTEIPKFTEVLPEIKYRYEVIPLKSISIRNLLPSTNDYVTYEGSMTKPGCEESVTWIVMNKPIYMTRTQIAEFRELLQGKSRIAVSDNVRGTMPLQHRVLRTNINFKDPSGACNMKKLMEYKVNTNPKPKKSRK